MRNLWIFVFLSFFPLLQVDCEERICRWSFIVVETRCLTHLVLNVWPDRRPGRTTAPGTAVPNPPPALRLVPRPCKGRIYAQAFGPLLISVQGRSHVLVIRPLQGRGTVAPAQWWWVSSPLGCVSIREHLPPAKGLLWREVVRPHRPCSSLYTLHYFFHSLFHQLFFPGSRAILEP